MKFIPVEVDCTGIGLLKTARYHTQKVLFNLCF